MKISDTCRSRDLCVPPFFRYEALAFNRDSQRSLLYPGPWLAARGRGFLWTCALAFVSDSHRWPHVKPGGIPIATGNDTRSESSYGQCAVDTMDYETGYVASDSCQATHPEPVNDMDTVQEAQPGNIPRIQDSAQHNYREKHEARAGTRHNPNNEATPDGTNDAKTCPKTCPKCHDIFVEMFLSARCLRWRGG